MGFVAAFVVSFVLLLTLSYRWWTHKPENRKALKRRQYLGIVLAGVCGILAGMSIIEIWEPKGKWTVTVITGVLYSLLMLLVSAATKDQKNKSEA